MAIRFASGLQISSTLSVLVFTLTQAIAEEFNKPTVRVELRLIECRYDPMDEIGMRMNIHNVFAIEESDLMEEGPFESPNSVPIHSGFHCVLSREDINRSLTALSQVTDLRILTEPTQTLESGYTGDFEILVYTGNVPGGDSRTYSTEEYRARYPQQLKCRAEIGPHFDSGDEVELSLDCDLFAEPSLFEGSSEKGPQDATATFRVSGQIAMKRGETLVLGGFVQEGVEGKTNGAKAILESNPASRHTLLAVMVQ